MNLVDSPSYPSGHTTYGYTGAILLATLVPDRYSEMIARGAEYGNDRIVLGAHYAMDVLGGRTLATYEVAHLLANDPASLNRPIRSGQPIGDFRAAVETARDDLTKALETGCGDTVATCARQDIGRFSDASATQAFYAATQTYGLGTVHPELADKTEDVGALAPEAGALLTRRRIGVRRLFPAQPLRGRAPRRCAVARQTLTETTCPPPTTETTSSPKSCAARRRASNSMKTTPSSPSWT
jgi:hypothetical protein